MSVCTSEGSEDSDCGYASPAVCNDLAEFEPIYWFSSFNAEFEDDPRQARHTHLPDQVQDADNPVLLVSGDIPSPHRHVDQDDISTIAWSSPSVNNIFDEDNDENSNGVEEFYEAHQCDICHTTPPFDDMIEMEDLWAQHGHSILNLSGTTWLRCQSCPRFFHYDCAFESGRLDVLDMPPSNPEPETSQYRVDNGNIPPATSHEPTPSVFICDNCEL